MKTTVMTRGWLAAAVITGALAGSRSAAASPADCTDYADRTASGADRALNWDLSIPNNAGRCMKIKVGQTVRWVGSFSFHPLDNDGGDTPNPIMGHDATGNVTFAQAGTFGYVCGVHPVMTGAIQVAAATAQVPASGRIAQLSLAVLLLAAALTAMRRARRPR
jgi:plastocyanin